MIEQIRTILTALWQQDFVLLSDPHLRMLIYIILIATLILENGLLPATFLPGDSFLILTGIIIAKSEMGYWLTITLLTIASTIGYWLGYLQGRWLGKTKLINHWLSRIPQHYYARTERLLRHYDMLALLIARFIAFVRTIMPILIGITTIDHRRFQLINFISGFFWVFVLINIGVLLGHSMFFSHHQQKIMMFMTLLPLILIIVGLLGSIYIFVIKSNPNQ